MFCYLFLGQFPFFLIPTDENKGNIGVVFKLLRLTRLPKILQLLDMDKFNMENDLNEQLYAVSDTIKI